MSTTAGAETPTADTLTADYVVVGAGAMGMAFVDEIITHSDRTVLMIDRHGKPGGHWNDAYPFVRLHQPSFFYGVNSAELGEGRTDAVGPNAGLSELASGAEVCAYFDHVMQRRFLPSGRVTYLPSTDYADGRATRLASGVTHAVHANVATVDATYMNVKVPSTRPPAYQVDDGVRVIPPNDLPTAGGAAGGFVVVGAGKTAFDAVLWLLANEVDPDDISWVAPRDSWLLNRAIIQPGDGLRIREQIPMAAEATSAADFFAKLEAAGHFFRIDPSREPTMYRCATVTEIELEQLRRVERVLRHGRVKRLTTSAIELDDATVPVEPDTLFIDCTADALERRDVVPVFDGDQRTLQTVRGCQQVFSAGFIGRVETLDLTEAEKNDLATVIPHPDTPRDFLTGTLAMLHNVGRWSGNADMTTWLNDARLSPGEANSGGPDDLVIAIQAVENLERFLAEATC